MALRMVTRKNMALAALTLLLTLGGAVTPVAARDYDGYRDHRHSDRYSHQPDRRHERIRRPSRHIEHDSHYRHPQRHHAHVYRPLPSHPHRPRHPGYYRHHDDLYGAYGLGVLTGYLLGN